MTKYGTRRQLIINISGAQSKFLKLIGKLPQVIFSNHNISAKQEKAPSLL